MVSSMSQPDPDFAASPVPDVIPDSATPKTFGVLNIVFALVLMACGACYGMQLAVQPLMAPFTAAQQQQVQAAMNAERAAALRKLDEQEKAAKSDEEKAQIQAKRKVVAAQPVPQIPDISKFWTGNTRLTGYFVADIITGLVLNVLLFISGIGLLSIREWARVLAVWVAGAKIVRLVALYGYFLIAVVPVLANTMKGFFEEMFKNQPQGAGAPSPQQLEQMVSVMGIVWTVSAIAVAGLGMIYPAILLWQLNRRAVKAAFAVPVLPADYGPETAEPGGV
jgi:hypothetical protein